MTSKLVKVFTKTAKIWQKEAKVAKNKSPPYDFKNFFTFEIYLSSSFQKYLVCSCSSIFYSSPKKYTVNTYPCRGFLASPKGYVLPTHITHLGRLDGFDLPSNNVNTMSLARTYPGIPSSRLEGQYHPHPSALK